MRECSVGASENNHEWGKDRHGPSSSSAPPDEQWNLRYLGRYLFPSSPPRIGPVSWVGLADGEIADLQATDRRKPLLHRRQRRDAEDRDSGGRPRMH